MNYTSQLPTGEVSKEVAESLGMAKPQGAFVSSVEPGSPAEKAGIEAKKLALEMSALIQ